MSDKEDILKLEHEFWTTMAGGQHQKSADLLAPRAAMVSSMGSLTFTPEEYVKMGNSSPFSIIDWSMSDEEVIFPTPNSAVCMYRVKQALKRDGKTEITRNVDTSVWMQDAGAWKCILHTESPAA